MTFGGTAGCIALSLLGSLTGNVIYIVLVSGGQACEQLKRTAYKPCFSGNECSFLNIFLNVLLRYCNMCFLFYLYFPAFYFSFFFHLPDCTLSRTLTGVVTRPLALFVGGAKPFSTPSLLLFFAT